MAKDFKDMDQNFTILAEECAEVIHVIMKIKRFGLDYTHPKIGKSNREVLTQEIGDVVTMIDILMENDIFSKDDIQKAYEIKVERLKKWYRGSHEETKS